MKDVRIGFSLSRIVLDWKVSMAFNLIFLQGMFWPVYLVPFLCTVKTETHEGQQVKPANQVVSDRNRSSALRFKCVI